MNDIETQIESSLLHTTASTHPLEVKYEMRLSNRLKMEDI